MTRYWTSNVVTIRDEGPLRYGCHVFERDCGPVALCQAYGHTPEAAKAQADCIIAALEAVIERPAVAAKARHYLVRSPKIPSGAEYAASIMKASPADADLLERYDNYFDACQQMNRIPKTYEEWKGSQHE